LCASPVSDRTRIDSLAKILDGAKPEERMRILLQLSKEYINLSIDTSGVYAKEALITAKAFNEPSAVAEAYKQLGNINYRLENYHNVLQFYDSSLSIFNIIHDSGNLAKVWNNLGILYQSLGDYDKSISFHLQAVACKIRLHDSLGIASSYNNIGSIYYDLEDFVKSKEYFLKALNILEKSRDNYVVANLYNNLGVIAQELHHYEKSIEYFNKATLICRSQNIMDLLGTIYHNMGQSKFKMGEFSEALDNYFRSVEILDSIGMVNCQTLNNIGQVYIELDYYGDAQKFLFRALKIARERNQFIYLRDIYNNLAVLYERQKKFDKAYEYLVQYMYYEDSLKNQMYSNKIENIQSQNELNLKQKEIERLNIANQLMVEKRNNDIRKQHFAVYTFVAGIIAIFIIALVVYKMFRQKTKANLKLKQQNEEIRRSETIIKKINKALSENEDMLRKIFEASPSAIIVLDSEMVVLDCNNASLRMFNTSNKCELISKNFQDFLGKDITQQPMELLSEIIIDGQSQERQFSLTKSNGSEFKAELSGGMIKDTSGKTIAFVVIINDITERLQFIGKLNQARIEAEESDRLKTAFLANMSHEIRTPMNSILGFSNLLSETDFDDEKKVEYLKHILQSSNILLNLIDDIIDISKIEAGHLNVNIVESNVNKLVREVFSTFNETKTKQNIELRLILPPESELISVQTDPLRVRQIVTNLIGNALKFTEKGFVELGYNIKNGAVDQFLEFYVKDTGVGIPLDKQAIIFERFRQVDEATTRKYGGTGLGLAISKKLVGLLGGNIWVDSTPNEGSVFYFTLPYSKKVEVLGSDEPFHATKYNWKGRTILIAEDENSNYELIKASIYRTGIKIIRAHNGEEAVEHIERNNGIDLVLMDIRMPRMNGYEATRKIKSLKPGLPVISITAYAMSEDKAKSLEAGCDVYISKPIKPSRLLSLLNDFIPAS
jgi:PAS domain S-box-containing protein